MADRSRVASCIEEGFEAIDFDISDSDSTSWEVINPSDSDEADSCSYVEQSDDEDDTNENRGCKVVIDSFGSPSSDLSMQSLSDGLFLFHHRQLNDFDGGDMGKDESNGEYNADDDEEEDEEYDLDDELVPKGVCDRFGRERMRKLGKRAYPKMNKSKRLPYYYNRPGCVHGKHGLGLKHSLI